MAYMNYLIWILYLIYIKDTAASDWGDKYHANILLIFFAHKIMHVAFLTYIS